MAQSISDQAFPKDSVAEFASIEGVDCLQSAVLNKHTPDTSIIYDGMHCYQPTKMLNQKDNSGAHFSPLHSSVDSNIKSQFNHTLNSEFGTTERYYSKQDYTEPVSLKKPSDFIQKNQIREGIDSTNIKQYNSPNPNTAADSNATPSDGIESNIVNVVNRNPCDTSNILGSTGVNGDGKMNMEAMKLAPWEKGICWIPSAKSWAVTLNIDGRENTKIINATMYNSVQMAYKISLSYINNSQLKSTVQNPQHSTLRNDDVNAWNDNKAIKKYSDSQENGRKTGIALVDKPADFDTSQNKIDVLLSKPKDCYDTLSRDENADPQHNYHPYINTITPVNVENSQLTTKTELDSQEDYGRNLKRIKPLYTSTRQVASTIPAGKLIADAAELPHVQGVRWSPKYLRFEVQYSNSTTSFSAKTAGVKCAFQKALNWLRQKKDDNGTGDSLKKKTADYLNEPNHTLSTTPSSLQNNVEIDTAQLYNPLDEDALITGSATSSIADNVSRRRKKRTFPKNGVPNNMDCKIFDYICNKSSGASKTFESNATSDTENRLHLQKLSVLICIDDLASRCYPTMNREERNLVSAVSSHDPSAMIGLHCRRVREASSSESLLPYLELFSLPIKRNELPSMLSRDAQLVMMSAMKMNSAQLYAQGSNVQNN